MKRFKHVVAVLALAMSGLLTTQAQASEEEVLQAVQPMQLEILPQQETQAQASEERVLQVVQPIAAFSQSDIDAMFDQQAGQPMQLAALSGQEMWETEGARNWHAVRTGWDKANTVWRNTNFDGYNAGTGRIFQVRYKGPLCFDWTMPQTHLRRNCTCILAAI